MGIVNSIYFILQQLVLNVFSSSYTHYIITVVVVVEAGVVSYRVSLSSSSVVFMSDFISQKKECKL